MAEQEPKTYKQGWHPTVTANHALRTAEHEAAFILNHLKPHYHILDLGCGPGTITTSLAKYVPEGSVTGIDITPDVIAQAKDIAEKKGGKPKNVDFLVGNVLDGLPYEDGKFDVVFCSQVLLHIPEPVKAMKELRRVCKEGGFVADREGDMPFRWYPYLPGLQLYNKYQYMLVINGKPASEKLPDNPPFPDDHRCGSLVHVWAREAGFDPLKIVKSAKTSLWATPEERATYAGNMSSRVVSGGHREKFIKLGATAEEVDSMVSDMKKWADHPDGMHWLVQFEIMCYK